MKVELSDQEYQEFKQGLFPIMRNAIDRGEVKEWQVFPITPIVGREDGKTVLYSYDISNEFSLDTKFALKVLLERFDK